MEIKEEKLKEILEEQRQDYQRYLGVVSEDFGVHVKILAETIGGVQEQLVSLREMVARNAENIEIIKMDIQFIKQELKHKVDQDEFDILEKRVLILERNASKS